ncbi:MAG: hypothetical protein R2824_06170 [Saprospiraceae bacterium]|nr:hypothetical protein [Lewinella sp.]
MGKYNEFKGITDLSDEEFSAMKDYVGWFIKMPLDDSGIENKLTLEDKDALNKLSKEDEDFERRLIWWMITYLCDQEIFLDNATQSQIMKLCILNAAYIWVELRNYEGEDQRLRAIDMLTLYRSLIPGYINDMKVRILTDPDNEKARGKIRLIEQKMFMFIIERWNRFILDKEKINNKILAKYYRYLSIKNGHEGVTHANKEEIAQQWYFSPAPNTGQHIYQEYNKTQDSEYLRDVKKTAKNEFEVLIRLLEPFPEALEMARDNQKYVLNKLDEIKKRRRN